MTKITMITNTGCGYCNAARKITQTAAFQTWTAGNGVVLTEAKYNSAEGKAALKLFGIKGTLKVPLMLATDDSGNKIGFISYRPSVRNRTPENLIAALSPIVCGGSCSPSTGETRKTCPTCKGVGTVLAAIVLSLVWMTGWTGVALSTGCVWTKGTFEPAPTAAVPNPPKVSVWRFAILYPFEVADVAYDPAGSFHMGSYKTSGGAAELVPLVNASGELVGTVMGKTVKAAVAP